MVTKNHKKGRPSSNIDRNRIKFLKIQSESRMERKLVTHRINYYAMKNNITKDGTQVFVITNNFEEE